MNELSRKAFAHIAYLVDGIGPRPAGSQAAEITRRYLKEQLLGWGYQPEEQPVEYAPIPKLDLLLPLTGLVLLLLSWWVVEVPWLSLLLPVWGAAVPQISRWMIFKRPRKKGDFNVVASTVAQAETPRLLLCAHYDSAQASVFRSRLVRKIQNRTYDIYQRAAIAVALISFISLVEISIPIWLVWLFRVGGSMAGAWFLFATTWEQIAPHREFSPGANDNASGVGVLLALAEYYVQSPPENLQLTFLFTAAEETGMHGARVYADRLAFGSEPLLGVINLDMVGTGDCVRYVQRDGTLTPTSTSAMLNDRIRQAEPDARPIRYTIKSGDFLAFLKHNIPAASLEVTGSADADLAYHSREDRMELIQPDALKLTLTTLQRVVGNWA